VPVYLLKKIHSFVIAAIVVNRWIHQECNARCLTLPFIYEFLCYKMEIHDFQAVFLMISVSGIG